MNTYQPTQTEFCNTFGIARSTLYDRMTAYFNEPLKWKQIDKTFLAGWLSAELVYNPVRERKNVRAT